MVRSAVLPGIIALALLASGCGSSSPTAQSTATQAQSTTSSETTDGAATAPGQGQLAAFQACLKAQGVNLGQPGQGQPQGAPTQGGQAPQGQPPGGANGQGPQLSAKQRKAVSACQDKLPAGSTPAPGAGQSNAAVTKYTTCLRTHGATFGAANNQAAFQQATKACAKLAPK
jgi:hypothetical protein